MKWSTAGWRGFFGVGILATVLSVLAAPPLALGDEAPKLSPVAPTPLFGTFYSIQRSDWPPFPFNPFPDLPVYASELKGVYWFDDRTIDYAEIRKRQAAEQTAPEGGGGEMMLLSGGGGLKLTIPVLTNGYVQTTIYDHDPSLAYDVYTRTNLNSTNWLFGAWGVVGQTNYSLLESLYPVDLFLMAASSLDSDGDGMPDNWEAAYGLNPHSAADAGQDPDGDGLTNLQEFLQGSSPTSTPTFQVFITSPRNFLP
jgi:hypothetical protein